MMISELSLRMVNSELSSRMMIPELIFELSFKMQISQLSSRMMLSENDNAGSKRDYIMPVLKGL